MVTWNTKCPVCGVDEADCVACWLGYEEMFAAEAHDLTDDLEAAVAEMFTDDKGVTRGGVWALASHAHDTHCLVTDVPEHVAMCADAAELIASLRGTNDGPTRPRVVAWLAKQSA